MPRSRSLVGRPEIGPATASDMHVQLHVRQPPEAFVDDQQHLAASAVRSMILGEKEGVSLTKTGYPIEFTAGESPSVGR